ncbi:uncharacterized protein MONOS_17939 [Monocercomonoides exilis]|uniref:uncharacterized protein n=1 Tax=Monocercomonoides exilis TaxID=2049356 RepID=UPI00355A74AD|nr:hypothetical protein MONOS_17939 [Monocercomonoides exilis]
MNNMSSYNADEYTGAILELSRKEKFSKLFSELERCNEDAQEQKIVELNEIIDEMNEELFKSVFAKDLLYKILQMIDENKLPLVNAILLMKNIGYNNVTRNFRRLRFYLSSQSFIIDKMISEEEKKKEGKNEKLLVDLCECYFFLSYDFTSEMLSICVPRLLKAAMNKEESKGSQKEVEIALLALSCISENRKVPEELCLNEIREIIKYHQKHHNLTSLAYQSAWQFLICRLFYDRSLEDVILNKLQFEREAISELEELTKCIDWKKNEDKLKEMEEENLLEKWITTLNIYFKECQIQKKEHVVLIECIIQILQAAKDNHREIEERCTKLLRSVSYNATVEIEDLLKSGAVYMALVEIVRFDFMKTSVEDYLQFFENICERLKKVNKKENEETKRKETKRKVFDRLEEEGYEDGIISLRYCFFKGIFGGYVSIQYIEDYFVHC